MDVETCALQLISAFDNKDPPEERIRPTILLKHDVVYTHQAGNETLLFLSVMLVLSHFSDRIFQLLKEKMPPRDVSIMYHKIPLKLEPASTSTVPNTSCKETVRDETELGPNTIFYIGGESLGLANLLITNSSADVRITLLLISRIKKLI